MNSKLVALALFAGTGIAMAQMTIRPENRPDPFSETGRAGNHANARRCVQRHDQERT
jgi:hypothetical protein